MQSPKPIRPLGWNHQLNHAIVANTHEGHPPDDGHRTRHQRQLPLTDDIRLMVDATGAGIIGSRDRALVLLGFAGAFPPGRNWWGWTWGIARSARTA